jgi:hypothetical protein
MNFLNNIEYPLEHDRPGGLRTTPTLSHQTIPMAAFSKPTGCSQLTAFATPGPGSVHAKQARADTVSPISRLLQAAIDVPVKIL